MTFDIGPLQAESPHLLADLIELIVLLELDGRQWYHADDICSILRGQEDAEEHEPRNLEESVRQAWPHLTYREAKFGGDYPFRIARGRIGRRTRLTAGARVYALTLACARLRSFTKPTRIAWAGFFVRISQEAFRQLLPGWAEVRVFDANSDDRVNYYGTNLRHALVRLGSDLAANSVIEAECMKQSASGDLGIDLVARAPWAGDNAAGLHSMFGQCAAREDEWPAKVLEAHPTHFRSLWTLLHDPVNVVFIPVLFRGPDGQWINSQRVSGSLLVDRVRIWWLLRQGRSLGRLVQEAWFTEFETQLNTVRTSVAAGAA